MDYTFMTLFFSGERKLIRMHFLEQEYYAFERFFNDDALLLWPEIEYFLQHASPGEELSLAGNRSVITLTTDTVRVVDQWENYMQGRFKPSEIPYDLFKKAFLDWKEELEA